MLSNHRTLASIALALNALLTTCHYAYSEQPPPKEQITTAPQPSQEQIDFFEKKIRPVFIEHCYECHSAQSTPIQAGLTLDSAQGLLRGGDSGPAIEPNKSTSSLIIQALRDSSNQMPPSGKLPDQVIADFIHWIDSGAYDPRTSDSTPVKKEFDFNEAKKFWSFVPPSMPIIPDCGNSTWPESSIDHFILATMQAHNLNPVGKATKRQLIRRATFDLTGLPPSPEEIESFLADESSNAFAKVIDRLLQSHAYGERWGRYWLDVARYSEDQAHTFSVQPNTNGYRFRDWVIDAFNEDLPFDRFIQYQIAADLMEIDEPEKLKNLAALGYFGLGAQYYKNTDAAKAAADELDDRIDTLTRGFLGLTVSCARCHDHKFDPIPQQDYYSLAGVFHSSRLHNAPLVPSTEVNRYNQSQQTIKKHEESIGRIIAENSPKLRESKLAEVSEYLVATRKLAQMQASTPSVQIAEFAQSHSLDETVLKRWVDFLKSKSNSPPLSLKAWFTSIESTSPDDVAKSIAGDFQHHLELLLRQRDGTLTPKEQTELSKQTETGNARYASPKVTKSNPKVAIDVDVTGAKELFLVVNDGGNGASCDHADWLEPKLITMSGELALTELKWREVSTSFGTVHINSNVSGQPLRVAGQLYSNGLGTHSTSVITYDLPEGTTRFTAFGGLDNSGSDQGGDCGANATIQFRVYTEPPTDIEVGKGDLLTEVFGEKGVFAMDNKEVENRLPEESRTALASLREELEQARRDAPSMYPIAHVIADASSTDIKVMVRGNPAKQGEVAPRRFLKILSGDSPPPFTKGSGRLELAQAITSPENPLTARVIVNRLWQHHFGRGLVGTPDNFGKLGESPTHPELLDYLTLKFIQHGWSLKALHREMMLSSTYQLSTDRNEANMQIDADNRFLWRMNRQRLDVEAWRDALLATSGRLDRTLHGPSTNLADATNNRRTIYAFISRHELDNMLRLFDFPDANITSSTRSETTVPQQQLFVLNSPFMIEQSKAFALRIEKQAGSNLEDQIQFAYLMAFGRPASERELNIAIKFLKTEETEEVKSLNKLSRWERYAQALLGSNEFMYLD